MAGKTTGAAATPVMRQFFAAKEAHPDALLFFRMGDFYELFFEDAQTAAKALDLTLTARNKGADDEIPMAGVPHHAASGYIQRLLDQGFRVAICEQMADPSKVKGIVPREVVRVVTPGITYDDASIDARKNHYLVALERASEGAAFGVAALDASTGELVACSADDENAAVAELVRLDPAEVLAGPGTAHAAQAFGALRPRTSLRLSDAPLTADAATALLDGVLGAGESARACPHPLARRAAARCVELARSCEPGRALPIARLVAYELGETLLLDDATLQHLELVRTMSGEERGSLLSVLDATVTPGGARLLRRRLLAPRTGVSEIRRRHDAVELFVTQPLVRAELRRALAPIADLDRLSVKLAMDRAGPRDLLALRRSLDALPAVSAALSACPDASARETLGAGEPLGTGERERGGALECAPEWIDENAELRALLNRSLADDAPLRASEGGVVKDGFDPELDELRGLTRDGQRFMVELEARLRESAQIPSLKVRYTRVFGWYLEVTRAHVGKAPDAWRRKQTVATGERFTCDELDDLADKLAHAEERLATREAELFATVCKSAAASVSRLRTSAERVADLDVASALAELAHREDWVRPTVDDSTRLDIVDGRHPVVEKLAAAGRFVPNDVTLDADGEERRARLWLVTGPNMAGKSTLMRQVALIVLLAQMGAFVPAKRARIGVVDRVLTRVGASDNLSRGESTFMVEMKETANVLRRATRRSLVVLDEIGRGTSTYDGLAIAWAVAEHLHDVVACRALFATHYHELTELSEELSTLANVSVSAREHAGDIVFLHKLSPGAASRSYGVACARLAGLPEPVLARARVLLDALERTGRGQGIASREAAGAPQLDLFGGAHGPSEGEAAALLTLRNVDIDRLTPLEALQMLADLKRRAARA
jgi:DNA mismatch repair protein MutS